MEPDEIEQKKEEEDQSFLGIDRRISFLVKKFQNGKLYIDSHYRLKWRLQVLGSDEKLLKWVTEYKKGFSKPIILLALAKKENYPYNLTREIAEQTKGQIAIAGSNIYPILKNLVNEGLIQKEKVAKPTKSEDTAKKQFRSVYSLTAAGYDLLEDLKGSLKEFIDILYELIEE